MDPMDDFGDTGATAKSYVSSATKGPAIPTTDIPGVTCPSKGKYNKKGATSTLYFVSPKLCQLAKLTFL